MAGLLLILGMFMFVFGMFSIINPKKVLNAMYIFGVRSKKEYSNQLVSTLFISGIISSIIGLIIIINFLL